MRSTNHHSLNLQVCDDQMKGVRLDNHVCISDTYKNGDHTFLLNLQAGAKKQLLGHGVSSVKYPVMFTSEMKPGQIIIPREIRSHMEIPLHSAITADLTEAKASELSEISNITFEISDYNASGVTQLNADEIEKSIKAASSLYPHKFPLLPNQVIVFPVRNKKMTMHVKEVLLNKVFATVNSNNAGYITSKTNISLMNGCAHKISLSGGVNRPEFELPPLESIPVDFTEMGVGGFENEISQLIRSVFTTFGTKRSHLDSYGVEMRSKGVLFYGPPGTGKTLIASKISKLFTKEPMIIIHGPQLKNRYYGATQKNLNDIFAVARENPKNLYVYLFDEIDSLFGVRNSDSSVTSTTNTDLVEAFCTILDGVDSPKNIIVIGTTNRKELIDPALLRAGRLDTHIYIGLPHEEDRLKILRVHTRSMSRILADNVDLPRIAHLTRNYSGAELARVVRVAVQYALEKNFTVKNNLLLFRSDIKSESGLAKVTQNDFLRALSEVVPMFGVDVLCRDNLKNTFTIYNDNIAQIAGGLANSIEKFKSGGGISQLNILIAGPSGVGKSSLASYLASRGKFSYVQVLTANQLLSLSLQRQLEMIDDAFARARQSTEPSVLILEDLENLIESTPDQHQYTNKLRMKLIEMLKQTSGSGQKLLVIATAGDKGFINKIRLGDYFNETVSLEKIRLDFHSKPELLALLHDISGVNVDDDIDSDQSLSAIYLPIWELKYLISKSTTKDMRLSLREFISNLPTEYHEHDSSASLLCEHDRQGEKDVRPLHMFGGGRH